MAIDLRKQAGYILFIETVLNIIIGIGCLVGIILLTLASVGANNAMVPKHESIHGIHSVQNSVNPEEVAVTRTGTGITFFSGVTISSGNFSDSSIVTFAIGFAMIANVILLIVLLVHLLLLGLLLNGVTQKDDIMFYFWVSMQALFCAMDLCGFLIPFFIGLPVYVYVIKVTHYVYRIYSIHIIRRLADLFAAESAANKNQTPRPNYPVLVNPQV